MRRRGEEGSEVASSNVVEFRSIANARSVAPSGVSAESLELMGRAETLLMSARAAESDEMLELSYRAALRTAGALLNKDVLPVARGESAKGGVSARTGSGGGVKQRVSLRRVASSKRRRSVSQSAWVTLRNVQPEYSEWISRFENVAPLRERVRLGIERRIDSERARAIWEMSCDFLADVKEDLGVLPAVA